VIVQHSQVRLSNESRRSSEDGDTREAATHDLPAWSGSAAPDPDSGGERREHEQQVCELEPERETESHLPGRHEPASDDRATAPAPVAAEEEVQRERDAAARDHMQMAGLHESPRRVRKCRAGRDAAPGPGAELAGKEECAEERQPVGEDDEEVVDNQRRVDAVRRDQAGGGVTDQRVAEEKAVLVRPVRVRIEQAERVVQQCMPDPGHLPGLER